MNSKQLLTHLESCPKAWAAHIRHMAVCIQEHILALREFANLKPGNIADVCNKRADELEARLTRLLDSLPNY